MNSERSVGNDIVFALGSDRTGMVFRNNFMDKVLTSYEKSLLSKVAEKDTFFWMIWSAKEAAYKFASRFDPQMKFLPKMHSVEGFHTYRYPLSMSKRLDGFRVSTGLEEFDSVSFLVHTAANRVTVRCVVIGEFVLGVACSCDADFKNLLWGVKRIPSDRYAVQSKSVREFARRSIADHLGINIGLIEIEESLYCAPRISVRDTDSLWPISLSHDQFGVCFSVLLE
ncbi:4'-phosphopantetheinyl transferase family protein [Dyadobacter sp. OTU695]|uniref:4'-phosphopantetheinyl transferase family protein n=1 Tax=Dyadobacter sp. OTU695 TaxID=3043860 RepID=UPI00313CBC50